MNTLANIMDPVLVRIRFWIGSGSGSDPVLDRIRFWIGSGSESDLVLDRRRFPFWIRGSRIYLTNVAYKTFSIVEKHFLCHSKIIQYIIIIVKHCIIVFLSLASLVLYRCFMNRLSLFQSKWKYISFTFSIFSSLIFFSFLN